MCNKNNIGTYKINFLKTIDTTQNTKAASSYLKCHYFAMSMFSISPIAISQPKLPLLIKNNNNKIASITTNIPSMD